MCLCQRICGVLELGPGHHATKRPSRSLLRCGSFTCEVEVRERNHEATVRKTADLSDLAVAPDLNVGQNDPGITWTRRALTVVQLRFTRDQDADRRLLHVGVGAGQLGKHLELEVVPYAAVLTRGIVTPAARAGDADRPRFAFRILHS